MINFYRTPDGILYLHNPSENYAVQLEKGTHLNHIEQVIKKLTNGESGLVIVPIKNIHEAQASPGTDILYGVDEDSVTFYRAYIAILETDLLMARQPHPLEADTIVYLQGILASMQAMPKLAPLASVAGTPLHEEWDAQLEQMDGLYAQAESYAAWLAPRPVQALLIKIRQQRNQLRAFPI